MIFDIAAFASLVFVLFIVFDPFATMPLFISLTEGAEKKTVSSYAFKIFILSTVIMAIFMLVGNELLHALGISMNGFRVAGGLLLLMIAFVVVFKWNILGKNDGCTWLFVACPALMGPGAITTCILLSQHTSVFIIFLAGMAALLLIWVLLRYSYNIVKIVGSQAISVISRVGGILIAALAVERILTGISGWLNTTQIVEIVMMFFC